MLHKTSRQSGFALIELLISLVIMGLLVVGTLAGMALIRASELRKVVADVENIRVQMDNFKAQYEGMPGDLSIADQYWAGATNPGNDNNRIQHEEVLAFWEHLSRARLISKQFTGIPGSLGGSGGDDMVTGENVPASTTEHRAGFYVEWLDSPGPSLDGGAYAGWINELERYRSSNYAVFAKEPTPTGGDDVLSAAVLTAENALWIDDKIDNGIPNYGSVLAENGDGQTGCYADQATLASPSSVNAYLTDSNDALADCILYFDMGNSE